LSVDGVSKDRMTIRFSGSARRVVESRDFSLRAARTTDDEIGTLADGWSQDDIDEAKRNRVRTAILLTVASPEYLAQR